jgi:hypothetical protein
MSLSTRSPRGHEGFTWRNIKGSIDDLNPGDGSCVNPCWYYEELPTLKHTKAVILGCDSATSCVDFQMSNRELEADREREARDDLCELSGEYEPEFGLRLSEWHFC